MLRFGYLRVILVAVRPVSIVSLKFDGALLGRSSLLVSMAP